jgi:hypothetical protein
MVFNNFFVPSWFFFVFTTVSKLYYLLHPSQVLRALRRAPRISFHHKARKEGTTDTKKKLHYLCS